MKLKLFAVHDSKVNAYMNPFVARAAGEAMRSFENAVRDPNSQISQFPADFTLFEIGLYDEETAEVRPLEAKLALCNALEIKSAQQ